MISFPDLDTLDKTADPWPANVSGFALDDRPPPPARQKLAETRRSLFDDDFDRPPAPDPREEPEIIEPTFSLAEYEAAREEAFRAGQAAEREAAEAALHAADRQVLSAIAAGLDAAYAEAERVAEDTASAIGGLLLDTLAALFPALCSRFGPAETQAVIRTVLPVLRHEPRATVRVPPALVGSVVETITRVDPDLIARIDIEPDPAVPEGDVRVTWRNGEVRRDARALWRDIGDILGQTGWPVPPPAAAFQPANPRTIPATMKETADVE